MLTRLELKNLRGIRSLKIEDAGLINIVVGPNNAGKTTILEAIRLLVSGDPRGLRRRSRTPYESRQRSLKEQYLYAFYRDRSDNKIAVNGTLSGIAYEASAEIRQVRNRRDQALLFDEEAEVPSEENVESLLRDQEELVVKVVARIPSKSQKATPTATTVLSLSGRISPHMERSFRGPEFPEPVTTVFLGINRNSPAVLAGRFSTLVRMELAQRLIEVLSRLEPQLRGLVVLTDQTYSTSAPARPVLEAELGESLRLPLENLGDGFTSALSVVSAIGTTPGGLCLVDEIENGIYYEVQGPVWTAVQNMASLGHTQVWATTHSFECIRAAYEVFRGAGSDALRVHRVEREGEETICTTLGWDDITSAFKFGMEVR